MNSGCSASAFLLYKEESITIRIRKGKAKTKPTAPKERVNHEIDVSPIRLIDENGNQMGVVSIQEAQIAARKANLDLVEIAPGAKPPVCKIMDFGQHHYQKERKLRETRKKQHVVQLKEIKFGPNTEEHDYKFKMKNAIKFLVQHNKVKFTVRFRGRQLAHKDIGFNLLERIQDDISEFADIDAIPKSEGRTIFMIAVPKKDIETILNQENQEEQV